MKQPKVPTPRRIESQALWCPFCGNNKPQTMWTADEPQFENETGRIWWTECGYCGSQGPVANTEPEAIERWNLRASPDNPAVFRSKVLMPLGNQAK